MKTIFIFSFIVILCGCSKEKSLDLNLKKELAEIEFRDQFVREISATTPYDSIELFAKKLNVNPDYFKNNYKSFAVIIDGQNLRRIEEIIKKHGYPSKSLVGIPENKTAWLIIHHSNKIEKYLRLLRNAATNGDLPQTALALTEDRYLMNHEKEQIYGSQATIFNGENIIWPIKNPEKVNELRKKIGFTQTVEEYSKSLFGKDFQYKAYTLEEIKKSSKTTE